MDVSDIITRFLKKKKVDAVFCVSGGSIHNLLAKIDAEEKIDLIPCYNEQGAVYAAEAYAREKNSVGVVIVTSGPGLTNIITGINSCWVDGIPLMVIGVK